MRYQDIRVDVFTNGVGESHVRMTNVVTGRSVCGRGWGGDQDLRIRLRDELQARDDLDVLTASLPEFYRRVW